jgi:hypothetical protein
VAANACHLARAVATLASFTCPKPRIRSGTEAIATALSKGRSRDHCQAGAIPPTKITRRFANFGLANGFLLKLG